MNTRAVMTLSALVLLAPALVSSSLAQSSAPLKTVTRGTVSTTAVEWPDIVARKKGMY
jgi:hypothetical protein